MSLRTPTASHRCIAAGHRRIAVVGTTGCGKTTLARQLAQRLAIPHVELDALHWDPGWTPAPPDLFRQRTAQALSGETWVVDGNYHVVRDVIWSRADTLVWLDYALPVILAQLFRRTIRRIITREVLWNENREHFRAQFFSRDSLFLWVFRSYSRRRREYPLLLQQPAYAHLALIRLSSPRATRTWLSQIGES